ncbi:MAG: cupin domain-containing protein [Bacteroidia bacterium]
MGEQGVNAEYLIQALELAKHPEGGYFKEVYRSIENLGELPERFNGIRSTSTSIYFLLNENDKSHFHKIKSDETWHFYSGSAAVIHMIDKVGNYSKTVVGSNITAGESFQVTIPYDVWFAAELINKKSYGLFGCTVAPGFNFHDFELANAKKLSALCPDKRDLIATFCLS